MLNLTLKAVEAYTHRNKETPSEVVIFNSSASYDQIKMFKELFTTPLK